MVLCASSRMMGGSGGRPGTDRDRQGLRTGTIVRVGLALTVIGVLFPDVIYAQQPAPTINQADTAWMLISTALVLLMTPALAFFYGGLVRSKNSLNTMMMSVVALGFVAVAWAMIGYSLAFSAGNPLVGDLSRVFLRGVGLEPNGTIPHLLFMCYQ